MPASTLQLKEKCSSERNRIPSFSIRPSIYQFFFNSEEQGSDSPVQRGGHWTGQKSERINASNLGKPLVNQIEFSRVWDSVFRVRSPLVGQKNENVELQKTGQASESILGKIDW